MTAIASSTLAPAPVDLTRPRLRARHLLVLLLIVAAFVDIPALTGIGPLSGMGALTIGQAAMTAAVLMALRAYPPRLELPLAPYGGFLVWATLTSVWMPPSFGGAQNWIVYVSFAPGALLDGPRVG